MSAGHPTLSAALAAFQGEMPIVPKGKTAKVAMKAGGTFTYTYAGLADVCEVAMPLLSKHGLSFTCLPRTSGDRGFELVGQLLHSSGESLEGALPIAGHTPQELGSSLTYMRRYLLGCMTGLVTDDDDDGQLAAKATRKSAAKPVVPPAEAWEAATGAITPKTRTALFALFEQKGVAHDRQVAGINHILGTAYDTPLALTEAHAQEVIRVLNTRPDAKPSAGEGDHSPAEAHATDTDPGGPVKGEGAEPDGTETEEPPAGEGEGEAPEPAGGSKAPPPPRQRYLNRAQQRAIEASLTDLKVDNDRDERHLIVSTIIGRQIGSMREPTFDEASTLLDTFAKLDTKEQLTALLDSIDAAS